MVLYQYASPAPCENSLRLRWPVVTSILLILLFAVDSKAQKKSKQLTDSTLIVGLIKEDDSYLCKFKPESCDCVFGRVLNRGERVLIGGIRFCGESVKKEYFEIFYDTSEYLIESSLIATDSNDVNQLRRFNEEQKKAFKSYSKKIMLVLRYIQLKEVLDFMKKVEKQGFSVQDWSIYDMSEYTEGTGIKFEIGNLSTKTIKYVWFSVVGYNPVGDPVKSKSGTVQITLKGVGPIPGKEAALYKFDYTWLTDLVEDAKITNVKVQYMDNTIKVFPNPKTIIVPEQYKNTLK